MEYYNHQPTNDLLHNHHNHHNHHDISNSSSSSSPSSSPSSSSPSSSSSLLLSRLQGSSSSSSSSFFHLVADHLINSTNANTHHGVHNHNNNHDVNHDHAHHHHNSNGGGDDKDDVLCQGLACYPPEVFTAVETVTILLALGGFLANGLTVLAILSSSLSANVNGILIGNLSFASLLYCSLVLPLQSLAYHHRRWVLAPEVCLGAAALRVWLIGVTMCLLSAIAVYREYGSAPVRPQS